MLEQFCASRRVALVFVCLPLVLVSIVSRSSPWSCHHAISMISTETSAISVCFQSCHLGVYQTGCELYRIVAFVVDICVCFLGASKETNTYVSSKCIVKTCKQTAANDVSKFPTSPSWHLADDNSSLRAAACKALIACQRGVSCIFIMSSRTTATRALTAAAMASAKNLS